MGTISSTLDSWLVSCHDLPPKQMIFGGSEAMRGLSQIVEQVAGANVPIVILGEKGTGKVTLACYIHACSPGPKEPFLKLTLQFPDGRSSGEVPFRLEPQLSEDLESTGGAFSSECRLCTLFVEEVSEVSQDCQLELLQLIQGFKSFIPIEGSDIPVALRVIATSSQDLGREVTAGRLREDLYAFLRVVTLRLSPLRERKEDIPQLANYFWRVYSEKFGCQLPAPSPELLEQLQEHDWPGNIRELENVLKRYVVLGEDGIKGFERSGEFKRQVAPAMSAGNSVSLKQVTREAAQALERKIILKTLQETQWNRKQTARALNISYRALLYKIKEAGLLPDQPRDVVDVPAGSSEEPDRGVI